MNEQELVKTIFERYGTGTFLVRINVEPDNRFQNVWEGVVQLESSEKLLFKASLNVLPDLTPLSGSRGPRTGKWKRVGVPEGGREKARRIVATEAE